jgi:UDP-N-acetylmuramate dehydrogenase
MHILQNELLSNHTTLRVGGVAETFVVVETQAELLDVLTTYKDTEILILGSGSNLVIADTNFHGVVIQIQTQGIDVETDACSGAMVRVQAGVNWDEFVSHAISNEWSGVEALSFIPGRVGATPIQNVGAYGQDVSQSIARVKTFDRVEEKVKTFSVSECDFGYRTSIFKQTPHRYVILEVTFQLGLGVHSAAITYPELAQRLGVEIGMRSKSSDVRKAVMELRSNKGMVLNESDQDTWSVGSFFTNPVVTKTLADSLPTAIARWKVDTGIKVSAAALVEHSGFSKGFGLNPRAQISTKHALALTNRGDARAEDIMELAHAIQAGVHEKFGILLDIEPQIVGTFNQ